MGEARRITGFAGAVPRSGERIIRENQAQVAANCRLTDGYFGPLSQPKLVVSPGVASIKAIFKMTDNVSDFWLAWNRDVDAAKGQIAGDSTYRTYVTGDGEPRQTNISLATGASPFPNAYFVLGVYPPQTAASLTHAGGAGIAVSRAFVYTFVTPFGEESQPSPPSAVVLGKTDGTWTFGATTAMDVAPLNSMAVTGSSWVGGVATLTVASTFGLRVGEEIKVTGMNPAGFNGNKLPITALTPTQVSYLVAVNPGGFVAGGTLARVAPHNTAGMIKRIYWLETLADGPHFRLVKEVPEATTNTTVPGNTISTAELGTFDWVMPPTSMRGITMMPNGITAAFTGNQILFSPPYIPYAYPLAYRLTTDFDIVGIEVTGTMLVVGTKGQPYKVTGIDPANMSMDTVNQPWVCLSKRSMVRMSFGVAFAAPQGAVVIGPGIEEVVTRDLYTQKEWKALKPETFYAAQWAGRYVFSYDAGGGTRQVIAIDKSEYASHTSFNANVSVFYGDQTTGDLFAVVQDSIYQWDGDAGQPMNGDWLSHEFVFGKPINLGAAKVDVKFTVTPDQAAAAQVARDAVQAANAALIAALATKGSVNAISVNGLSVGGSKIKQLPPLIAQSLVFQLYVDGAAKFSKSVVNADPFRLPGGYKSDNAAVRISGNLPVKAVVFAETMTGLQKV